jgi:hypothetical protein
MAGLSFTAQIKREFRERKASLNALVERATIESWEEAVSSSPVLTGRLRGGWRVSKSRRSSYITKAAKGKRVIPRPPRPVFKFNCDVDSKIFLFNNVPYASYVENGEGPGTRIPRMMLRRATIRFNSVIESGRGRRR